MIKSGVLVAAVALGVLSAGFGPKAANAGSADKSEAKRNIVQVAREAGSFKTLLKALEATGLVGTLSGQGQGKLTVFAPTDEAFAKLPVGTVESLLKDTLGLPGDRLMRLSGPAIGSRGSAFPPRGHDVLEYRGERAHDDGRHGPTDPVRGEDGDA